jgi:hypothetical protein
VPCPGGHDASDREIHNAPASLRLRSYLIPPGSAFGARIGPRSHRLPLRAPLCLSEWLSDRTCEEALSTMWLHGPGQMPPGTVLDTARAGRTIEVERAGLTSSASHLREQG